MLGVAPAARTPDRGESPRSGGNRKDDKAEADGRLMAAVAAGEAGAFRQVVDAELQRVLAVARRVLGNDGEAEDVAQEALLRLWQQAANWRAGEARIRTWLHRVAVNLSIDRLRRRREESDDAAPERAAPGGQQRRIEARDLARAVDQALQALPERQRIALALFHYEGASMAEVADAMETSPDAVESLLGRGRRALKALLADRWREMLPDDET